MNEIERNILVKEGGTLNHLKWIKTELENWVSDEIITPEQQALILARYEAEASSQVNPILILFSIIGATLVGAGIILIFATNWWRMPLPLKLAVAFLPLAIAQGICVFTALKRWRSAAFREGSATFLVAAFFATVALVGQAFHIASDLREFVLLCGAFALPVAYLFRSRAALTAYVACAIFANQSSAPYWLQALILGLATAPLFYMEIKDSGNKGGRGYLTLLLSAMICVVVIPATHALDERNIANIALSAAMALLLADEASRKLSPSDSLTPAKLLGCIGIAVTIIVAGIDFEQSLDYGLSLFAVIALCGYYAWLRMKTISVPTTADLLAGSAFSLAIATGYAGVAANALLLALGVSFIALGGKQRRVFYVNIGMGFLIALIIIRFFDSSLSLLIRGVAFILVGISFLSANIAISRKWRKAK